MDQDAWTDYLWSTGVLQCGHFQLKSGLSSPFYLDFRRVLTQPKGLSAFAEAIDRSTNWQQVDLLCGVPYAAFPLSVALSLRRQLPFVIRRREEKKHGHGKTLEGVWNPGERCLIIEDLITTGSSILETSQVLEEAGLQVTAAVALLDRQQGGIERLEAAGIKVNTLWTLDQLLNGFVKRGYVTAKQQQEILEYVHDNRAPLSLAEATISHSSR